MSSKVLFPSLSEDGWVNSSVKVADYLLSHFFLSEYSQTYIYHKEVSSLPWILQEAQGDMGKTLRNMESTLKDYFTRYFNNVDVEVTDVTSEATPSKGELNLYVKFTDTEGTEHVLGKVLEITDTIISKIVAINNG